MQFTILLLIVSSVTFEFLKKGGILPGPVNFIPEVIGAVALLYVVAVGVRTRFSAVPVSFWITFFSIAVVMAIGVLLNGVEPGPLFAGIRTYLRAIPLFLLPAVYVFSERKLTIQLKILLLLCLIQLPIAIYQNEQRHAFDDGDDVVGTLVSSSVLSLFLMCAACILTGMYLKKRLSLVGYILLMFLILAPSLLNETKGTLILLPAGLLTTFIMGSPPGKRLRNGSFAILLLSSFMALFVYFYDTMFYNPADPYSYKLVDFFTGDTVDRYVSRGTGFGAKKTNIGRGDALRVAYRYTSRDPITLAFGLGIGNAAESSLGPQFQGAYGKLFSRFLQYSAIRLILEVGLIGLALIVLLMALVFQHVRAVAHRDAGWMGAFATGWLGVTVIQTVALFYKDLITVPAHSFLFWFYSGVVVAYGMQQRSLVTSLATDTSVDSGEATSLLNPVAPLEQPASPRVGRS